MRKWLALAALLVMASPAGAQVCDYDITATGSDRWQVWHADTLISEHTQYYQAVEVATRAETVSPADSTEIRHDAVHRVECPVPDVVSLDSVSSYPKVATFRPVGSSATWPAVPDSVWSYNTAVRMVGDDTHTGDWERWIVDLVPGAQVESLDTVPSPTVQVTHVGYAGDSIAACSGACDTIPGWAGSDLTTRQLAWLGRRIEAGGR